MPRRGQENCDKKESNKMDCPKTKVRQRTHGDASHANRDACSLIQNKKSDNAKLFNADSHLHKDQTFTITQFS